MKLFYIAGSPNCRRVVATIHHLNLPVELQTVDFFSPKFDEASFNKLNPNGMVPTLEEGSFTLWESHSIMRYLCEKKGSTDLYPSDLRSRTEVNRWMDWNLAHFGPTCMTFTWENMLKGMFGAGDPDTAALAEAAVDFRRFAAVFTQNLTLRKFTCGDHPTIADYSIAASLMHAETAKMPWQEFPALRQWYDRVSALDGWKKSAPPRP